jgi:hypothetical protein
MERDNYVILIIVGLVTLGVFTYLFHDREMDMLRDAVREIKYSNEQSNKEPIPSPEEIREKVGI